MKIQKAFILFTACLLLFTDLTAGSRDLPAEERKVADFTGINVAVPAMVYLVQGDSQKLVVEGTDRVLDNLVTEVKNGELNIYLPGRWSLRRNDKLNVYLVVTELNTLKLSGSGKIYGEGLIRAGDLSVAISGSGRIELEELNAENLSSVISGSGRFNIGGGNKIVKHKISISGSGRVESGSLQAAVVNARVTGSGRCQVNVTDNLEARITGSGRVVYTGNPLVDSKISGSGRVVNAN